MTETPERPWCSRPEACVCFGTVAPSTGMRDPESPLTVRCEYFTPDGGKTKTLRELR